MLNVGTVLAGRYEIIEKIGAGGMSDVYKAMDHSLGREVAIKVLKQEFVDDAGFVSKFRAEAQSAAGLEHPNIVNIYDVGSENGLYYIVMEYVEGITLKTYITKKGRLSYNELISIAIQVGRGIEAAHNKNIIHRDIKPQNIIISKEGKVKVTDFGIARAATSNTVNADLMGSVHYSSPEQARNGYVTFQSDIYSLGIVMFEMCTGRVPFDGETTVSIAIQHLQNDMPKASEFVPDVPISVERIIEKATMKSPDKRYSSMDEMLNDLKKALINPDEDFVQMPSEVSGATRVITSEELDQIQRNARMNNEEEYDEEYDDEEYDDEYYDDEYDEEYDDEYDDEYYDDDDDNDGSVNPKLEKAVSIMGIVAAVIIVFIIIYLLGNVLGIFHFKSSDEDTTEDAATETQVDTSVSDGEGVTVPNLIGHTEDEARALLKEVNLGYKVIGSASSDQYEEGLIIEQSINEGQTVEKNTSIQVTLSSGAGNLSIPNVEGMPENSAINTLTDAGFKYNRTYEYSNDVTSGNIIRQSPAGGASGKKGDTISIVVSQGVESISVPSVVLKTQEEAAAELAANNLAVGEITTAYHDTVVAGSVISQSIDPGTKVDSGTKINLVVSEGQTPRTYKWSKTFSSSDYGDGKTGFYVEVINAGAVVASGNVIAPTYSTSADGATETQTSAGSNLVVNLTGLKDSSITYNFYDLNNHSSQLYSYNVNNLEAE